MGLPKGGFFHEPLRERSFTIATGGDPGGMQASCFGVACFFFGGTASLIPALAVSPKCSWLLLFSYDLYADVSLASAHLVKIGEIDSPKFPQDHGAIDHRD